MKTISLLLAALFAAATTHADDCGTSLTIDSKTEYYLSATDILDTAFPDIPGPLGPLVPNPLKIPAAISRIARIGDAIQNGCVAVEFFSGGVSFAVGNGADPNATGSVSYKWDISASAAGGHILKLPFDTEVNGIKDIFDPGFKPCGEHAVQRIAHLGGDMSGYVFNGGLGAYPRRTTKGHLHICRNLMVQNGSTSSIELPLSVAGSLFIAGGLAADNGAGNKNYAKTWLKITGSVGGQSVSENAELSAAGPYLDAIGDSKDINTTRTITIAPGTGNYPVHIDLDCEGYLEIQAHGSAFFGFVAGAATAQVSFPNSIDIGWPTGPGGSALPPGVRIYDSDDGSVYADTTANPINFVPVSGETFIMDFSQPFDIGFGGMTPGANTVTANNITTLYSPPGTLAGLVRRADGDADPLANVTNHNAFRLSYTVLQSNTTPAITIFVYDKTGGTPHAVAYDLSGDQLTPGYHEVILSYGTAPTAFPLNFGRSGHDLLLNWTSGTLQQADSPLGPWTDVNATATFTAHTDAGQKFFRLRYDYAGADSSGRGVFAPGSPDFTRLHAVAVANTLITNWPAQSSQITTGLLAITFDHLAAVDAPASGFTGFAITNYFLDATRQFHLGYPADTNDYYILYWGSVVTAITNPLAMALGVNGPGEFILTNNTPTAFFRLREVPLAQPLDTDGDGVDDVTELLNPAIYNPLVPTTTIATNTPPDTGVTNGPSNSGQIYLWTLNNHRYMPVLVTNGLTWDQANTAAQAVGGHLATINSALENNFVFALIDRGEYWGTLSGTSIGPWLGGLQTMGAAEPAGGWHWVTTEPFTFTAWNAGAPNNDFLGSGTNEDRIQFWSSSLNSRTNLWNDVPGSLPLFGYVIEFEPPATTGDCIPRNGLVSWWRGDGNALDSAGTNNGVLMNGVTFTNGVSGQAFSLDGVSAFIQITNSPNLNPTNQISVAAWYQPPPFRGNGNNAIIGKGYTSHSPPYYQYQLGASGNSYPNDPSLLEFSLSVGGNSVGPDWGPYLPGNWYHLVGTYDGSNVNLYVNGALEGSHSANGAIDVYPTDIRIGGMDNLSRQSVDYTPGTIDDVLIYNRALTPDEIAGIYSGGISGRCKPQCVPPPSGLVAWWPGEGNANDIIGTNNGTLQGGTTLTNGVVGQAFSLDGVASYISVPDSPSLNPTNAISVEAWYKPTSFYGVGNNSIIDKPFTSHVLPYYQYHLGVTGDQYASPPGLFLFDVATSNGIASAVTPSGFWTPGNWYHLVGTYDGAAVKIYVNGSLISSVPASGIINNYGRPVNIGRRQDGYFTPGTIDEPRIYNRALSAGEIAGIYLAGSAGFCKPPDCPNSPTNLVAWWPADGNANDFVGTNNGTLQGGATFTNGIAGQAFKFNSDSDFVQTPEITHGWPEGTVQLWFNASAWDWSSTPVGIFLWAATQGTPPNGSSDLMNLGSHHPDAPGGELLFGIFTGQWQWAHSGITPQTNVWYHVAGTWGPAGIRIYVNGLLMGTNSYTGPAPANSLYDVIGRSSWPQSGVLGLIDDTMIFNRALTAAEIQSLYQSVTPPVAGPAVDHGGTNWTLTADTVLSGAHTNIGEFVIASGVSVNVAPFDGTGGGWLEIRAQKIRVDGTLNATGKGYPGGGGGGGGGGADQLAGGQPGNGVAGGAGYLGSSPGTNGVIGGNTTGGNGGNGGLAFSNSFALFPGLSGVRGTGQVNSSGNPNAQSGGDGGYYGFGTNLDTTLSDAVWPGNGGGGGGGGGGGHSLNVNSGGGGGAGGGSGGFGGGAIILRASSTLQVTGTILAQGTKGASAANGHAGNAYTQSGDVSPGGDGGTGAAAGIVGTSLGGTGGARACDTTGAQVGSCSGDGGKGGNGGAGAGGGILLRAPLVTMTGTINDSGAASTNNGGTVKILSTCGGSGVTGQITTGHLVQKGILMR